MNSQLILVGLILLLPGLLLFYGAVMNSDWLFKMRRSRLWVRLLGRTGAQIAFGLIGFAALFGGGFLAVAGMTNTQTSVILGTEFVPQFFDGGIRYRDRTVYLAPPPEGFAPRGATGYSRLYSYQQFATYHYVINYGNYRDGTRSNDDILRLIANTSGFSSGWVIMTDWGRGLHVEHEFVDVVSPTDWKFGNVVPAVQLSQ